MAVALVDNGIEAKVGGLSTSVTLSQTLTAGANLLVIFTYNYHGANGCTGVTYNGVSMTEKVSMIHDNFGGMARIKMWYLENPSTGSAYNIVATWEGAGSYDKHISGASFSGYGSIGTGYSNSPATNSTSANPSVTISDWESGDYAVGGVIMMYSTPTEGDTLIAADFSNNNDDTYSNCAYQTADGNLNWTSSAAAWAAVGAAIKPSTSPSLQYKLFKPSIIRST